MRTVADVLYDEAFERGIDEGAANARRRTPQRLLQLEFGGVSPETSARIEGATSATLERWTDRVLTATTIEDVLGD